MNTPKLEHAAPFSNTSTQVETAMEAITLPLNQSSNSNRRSAPPLVSQGLKGAQASPRRLTERPEAFMRPVRIGWGISDTPLDIPYPARHGRTGRFTPNITIWFTTAQMQPKHPSQSRAKRGVPVELSRPIETKQAIRGLQAGKSIALVAQQTGIAKSTVQRLKHDYRAMIEQKQEEAVERMLDVRGKALQRLEREMDDIPLASLPVTIGILSDKVRDLTGGTVSTIQHVSVKLPEDVKEATVIDLLPTTNPCEQPSDQEETQAGTEESNGLTNQGAADETDHQGDLDGAGGIEPVASGDHGTHTAGENFLSKWGKTQSEVEPEEIWREGNDQDDSHPSRTSVSEGTVKLSTDRGEEASRQTVQGEVEGGQI